MTDRIKGYLVTLEADIREDDSETILNALKMIKGVHNVRTYVKNMEDYMSEYKGRLDELNDMLKIMRARREELVFGKENG
jgi:hypothetical protein